MDTQRSNQRARQSHVLFHHMIRWALVFLVGLLLITQASSIHDALRTNLGWSALAKSLAAADEASRQMYRNSAAAHFQSIRHASATSERGYALTVLSSATPLHTRNEIESVELSLADRLYQGERALAAQDWERAINWANGDGGSNVPETIGNNQQLALIISRACQKIGPLAAGQPEIVKAACDASLAQNKENLLINGNFEAGLSGWSLTQGETAARFSVLSTHQGCMGSCACISASQAGQHGGWYQSISLPPGAQVKMSAQIIVSEGHFAGRTLYWETIFAQRASGNGVDVSEPTDGTYPITLGAERIIEIPPSDTAIFKFYPVLFEGEGTICIDNVRLELVNNHIPTQ